MELKTVAFLNIQYPGGGGETVTRNLGHFFRGKGFRVVIYAHTLIEEKLTDGDRRDFTLKAVPGKDPRSGQTDYDAFCRSLAAERIGCLIVQGLSYTDFARIRRETGCKIIFCLHSLPLWEVHAARRMRCADLPKPTFGRKLEFLFLRRPLYRLTGKLERRTLKRYASMLPHIDRMVMLCPAYRDQMQRLIRASGYPGSDAPAEKFMSMLNPLPPPVPAEAEAAKEQIVLYAGRLQHDCKRVDRLLRIWSRIEGRNPGWRLVVAGDGPMRRELERLARRLGLERVEFAGYQQDVTPYYRRAAFVCLTSNFEGLPMCLAEGQQYGAIPVSFDSFAGIGQIARDGETGIVVRAFDRGEYARRLEAAMRDESLQRHLRENCLRAARRYDLERIGAEWLRLFETLR